MREPAAESGFSARRRPANDGRTGHLRTSVRCSIIRYRASFSCRNRPRRQPSRDQSLPAEPLTVTRYLVIREAELDLHLCSIKTPRRFQRHRGQHRASATRDLDLLMHVPHPSSRSKLSAPAQWIHLGQVVLVTDPAPWRPPPADVCRPSHHGMSPAPPHLREGSRDHSHEPAFLAPSLTAHVALSRSPTFRMRVVHLLCSPVTKLTRFRSALRTTHHPAQCRDPVVNNQLRIIH